MGFDQIIKKIQSKSGLVCKMVSNVLPTLPSSPTRSNLPYSSSPRPIVSYTKTELSCQPFNTIAGNDSAITVRAVMATYNVSSSNGSGA